jgi:hypothetical protein
MSPVVESRTWQRTQLAMTAWSLIAKPGRRVLPRGRPAADGRTAWRRAGLPAPTNRSRARQGNDGRATKSMYLLLDGDKGSIVERPLSCMW